MAISRTESATVERRPLCDCHQEPMSRWGTPNGKQRWVCSVWNRERHRRNYATPHSHDKHVESDRRRYENLTGLEYARLRLRHRRTKALIRMEQRHLRIDVEGADQVEQV